LVDETGEIAWHTRTTLWGTTTWNRDATTYTPLRFPGQYHDPETGLHYNHFRYYDPATARYTTPDPLGLAPAPNPATYVHNPHTWCDPLGLAPDYPDDDGPAIGDYTSKGAGQDLKRSAMVGDDPWHFNTGHGYDRAHTGPGGVQNDLRTTGLKPDQIEQAIVSDVYRFMEGGGTVPTPGPGFSGPLERTVQIDGHAVGYRVIHRPDGAYQLSTYWLN
ncbi:RHS repeat-associated core domain-containing protein, partial [Streptomyces barkulensis]